MRRQVQIVDVRIEPAIEHKICNKHQVTPAEVREALILRNDVDKRWEDHPAHGQRLVALGTTYDGRPILAALLPVDVQEGIWILKTARSPKR